MNSNNTGPSLKEVQPKMRVRVQHRDSGIRRYATVELVSLHKIGVIVEDPGSGHLIFDKMTGMTMDEVFMIIEVL